ncbi:hypothetical protein SCLCIDRAFT_1009441 [Scleroderma citrinum Foug A]|uniref:Uncharacterized protein n=1 Tax=Scleroderma citrinum Foug A TaxID=1036808 RepID=A0A0C3EIY2_9AGAM|nr:hypothetical protein SCLCIDRAFT_1009441 [Scleroderma citrinum Foug A]
MSMSVFVFCPCIVPSPPSPNSCCMIQPSLTIRSMQQSFRCHKCHRPCNTFSPTSNMALTTSTTLVPTPPHVQLQNSTGWLHIIT